MIKKNPSYRVTIYTQKDTHIIEYPITCRFSSTRSTFSSSNNCSIDLYNLNSESRDAIFKDALTLDKDSWKYIKLEAGWNGILSQVFYGRILQGYTSKTGGQVDVISHIDCQPFDIFEQRSSHTFAAGTSYKEAYNTIANDLPNCQRGAIGTLEGTFKTQTTIEGMTLECLNEVTNGNTFVDNGVVNTLMSNEVLDVPVPLVTDENGLLQTPVRRDASLTIKMLFEPSLVIGQLLEVKSSVQPVYNGQYKVLGFTHDCLISPTQAGQRTTTVQLWIAPLLTGTDINTTGEQVQSGQATINAKKVKGEDVVPLTGNAPTGVKEVYMYLQNNNGKLPGGKITANISWREMIGNDNNDSERKSECTMAILNNCYNTAQALQKIIDTYFKGYKVIINSGWRSVRNNTSYGGKPDSKHLKGLAIDFYIPGYNTYNLYKQMRSVWNGYVGYYKKQNFVHIQVNSTRGTSNDR